MRLSGVIVRPDELSYGFAVVSEDKWEGVTLKEGKPSLMNESFRFLL